MDFHIEGQGQTQGKIQPLKHLQELRRKGLPRWLSDKKNSPANAEDAGYLVSIPWGRKWQPIPSTLAWRIPWTEEARGLQSMGLQSQTKLNMHAQIRRKSTTFSSIPVS